MREEGEGMRSSYRDLPHGVSGLGTLGQDGLGAMDGAGLGKPDVASEKLDLAELSEVNLTGMNEAELLDADILFALAWDQSCYRALISRQRALGAQLDAVERALSLILSRALVRRGHHGARRVAVIPAPSPLPVGAAGNQGVLGYCPHGRALLDWSA